MVQQVCTRAYCPTDSHSISSRNLLQVGCRSVKSRPLPISILSRPTAQACVHWLTTNQRELREFLLNKCHEQARGRTRTTIGRRDFAVSGPATWNSLPVELLTLSLSSQTFAKKLNQAVNDGVAHSKNPRKCAYHVTFDLDLDLDLEHTMDAGLPGDHRVLVWWRSGHLSARRSDLRKSLQTDGRTDRRLTPRHCISSFLE